METQKLSILACLKFIIVNAAILILAHIMQIFRSTAISNAYSGYFYYNMVFYILIGFLVSFSLSLGLKLTESNKFMIVVIAIFLLQYFVAFRITHLIYSYPELLMIINGTYLFLVMMSAVTIFKKRADQKKND